jgi:curli production assembly/transport component CsgG
MIRTAITLGILTILSGCATLQSTGVTESMPEVSKVAMQKEFDTIPPPNSGKPISVAVYSFQDKTGQRRPQANVASLSTAVTQGAESFLIKALQDVGNGTWFEVVERVGIDNLTKERLIIRQMREAYEGTNAKPLMPMQFAGMIVEGGIVGYDTSINSGGAGARWLGIGAQTQWTQDVVTVSLRAVSVNTGKVLISVTVQKTILSTSDSASALKFFDLGRKAFEAEIGATINEPGTYAVKSAVEAAVVELIKEGERKGVWGFKYPAIAERRYLIGGGGFAPKPEEKKDELVQKKTESQGNSEAAKTQDVKPSAGPTEAGSQEQGVIQQTGERKVEDNRLSGKIKLPMDTYVFKNKDEKSTRVWQFKKGTEVIVTPDEEDWYSINTEDGKKGFVRGRMLTPDKP